MIDHHGDTTAGPAAHLITENEELEKEIRRRGGTLGGIGALDPAVHNAFLKQVLAYDDAMNEPEEPLSGLFPDLASLPAPGEMDEVRLAFELDGIKRVLADHGMVLDLHPDVPPREVYRFLVEDYIPSATYAPGMKDLGTDHIDGCTGWCEQCFQQAWCEHPDDWDPVLPDDGGC